MFHSKRRDRSSRRRPAAVRPSAQRLETRSLLATVPGQIDLTNIAFGTAGGPAAYGVQEAAATPAGGAGWSVTDVGDVNADGFDDFVVGAPTVTGSGSSLALNNGNNSRAYLVFGSQQVSGSQAQPVVANFLNLTSNQRVGDLGTLGNNTQTNPTNPTALSSTALQFNGITFFTSQNPNSQLGASVTALGDINGDGIPDFMIGAPGSSNGLNANPGTGRAYIIYGGRALSNSLTKTIDLDNISTDLTPVITLFSDTLTAGSNLGFSGTSGDLIVDNFRDVAVGAPNADPLNATGLPQANAGEVYVLSGTIFPTITASTSINVDTVGQAGGQPGIIFTGNAGDQAGWSLAGVGAISTTASAFSGRSDLLIGAPQGNGVGNGKAYYINAQIRLNQQAAAVGTINQITLSRVSAATSGTLNTNAIFGAVFGLGTSANTGAAFGYSVAAAGNLGTGTLSYMIGAPDPNGNGVPAVYLYTGAPAGNYDASQQAPGTYGTQTPPTTGVAPTQIPFTVFQGNANDLAGFSETAVGDHNGAAGVNDIAIGAPGETVLGTAGAGEVYWISRSNNLTGNLFYPLSATGQTTTTTQQGLIGATVIAPPDDLTNATNTSFASFTTTPAFLGASVSGITRLFAQTGFTVDQDTIGDLVIGAPGYSLANYPLPTTTPIFSTSRNNAGSAFVIEGGLIPFTGTNTTPGGGGGGGGGGQTGAVFGTGIVTGPPPANLPLGSALIPTVASLSTYDSYQPLAESIAYAQFRPNTGWLLRMEVFSGKISQKNPNVQRHGSTLPGHNNSGVHTLNNHVFTRDKYHAGKVIKFTHKVKVIPRDRQHNVYAG